MISTVITAIQRQSIGIVDASEHDDTGGDDDDNDDVDDDDDNDDDGDGDYRSHPLSHVAHLAQKLLAYSFDC